MNYNIKKKVSVNLDLSIEELNTIIFALASSSYNQVKEYSKSEANMSILDSDKYDNFHSNLRYASEDALDKMKR